MKAAGLILAAGESRRMGSPKALLPFRGVTFLETLIELFAARCAPVIVVLGAAAEEVLAAMPVSFRGRIGEAGLQPADPLSSGSGAGQKPGAQAGRPAPQFPAPQFPAPQFVVNEDYLLGQTSSMQCGLRAVPADADGVLFTLVDHPAVSPATIETLLGPPLPLIRVPRFAAGRGHPVWFRREMIAEFLALPPDGAANTVVRAHRQQTEFVDVEDAGVIADIDDPAAYRDLLLSSAKGRA